MKTPHFSIFILLFFCSLQYFAQDIHIKSKIERIIVKEDSSFVREVSITFQKSEDERLYPIFYDVELENVLQIDVYEQKGNRLKAEKNSRIFEEKVNVDYIHSKKIKSVYIPKNKDIVLKYAVECKELMYLSSLHFFSYNKIDTLNYSLTIPSKFNLSYKISHKDSLSHFSLDSIKSNSESKWTIKTVPKKIKHSILQYFGIYKNMEVPLMRVLVYPSSYKNNPIHYMNDWYLQSIKDTKGLSYAAKLKIDEITKNLVDKKDIINAIYNYLRQNFKYVAIEVGMGAFIPSPVNEVYSNKQGDCKDLSNFLSEALEYKGIESNVALAATFDHINDCDFPSLSSANHVICVAYLDNSPVLLDPTDPIHVQGTPIQSLQNRKILIINPDGGNFHTVSTFSPEQNKVTYDLNITLNSEENTIDGIFKISYSGISDNYLRRALHYESKADFEIYANNHFEEIFGNQKIKSLKRTDISNKLNFEGNILIEGKTFDDNSKKYIFIDFLPRLIETESQENLLEGSHLNSNFQKKVTAKITLDKPIQSFDLKKFEYNEKDISLLMEIKFISDLEIEITYDFVFNYFFIKNNNVKEINDVLKYFKKITNEPIILNQKKV